MQTNGVGLKLAAPPPGDPKLIVSRYNEMEMVCQDPIL